MTGQSNKTKLLFVYLDHCVWDWIQWNIIKSTKGFPKDSISLDDFLGNKLFPNPNDSMALKINGAYSVLNIIGYWPDKEIDMARGFRSTLNDHGHAGEAVIADFLLSRDKRFIKKTKALYEYYEIKTKVIKIPEEISQLNIS